MIIGGGSHGGSVSNASFGNSVNDITVERTVQIGKNDDKCRTLGSDEKGFVCTQRRDTRNLIENK